MSEIINELEENPIIAAIRENALDEVIDSPVNIVFLLDAGIMTVKDIIARLHAAGKKVFVHLDLASGIGKDKAGVEYLAGLSVDGIISTRANIIHFAKEQKLLAVQRFFALDSQGVSAIEDMVKASRPDMIEIMPAMATKVIKRISSLGVPVIAGGLIEEKSEVLAALSSGAIAISTGKSQLWYI